VHLVGKISKTRRYVKRFALNVASQRQSLSELFEISCHSDEARLRCWPYSLLHRAETARQRLSPGGSRRSGPLALTSPWLPHSRLLHDLPHTLSGDPLLLDEGGCDGIYGGPVVPDNGVGLGY
jgi:hypothetical protein